MQAFQSPSLGLAVVLWYVGGAFVAGFVAALIVKAILDTDPAQSARLGTIFVALFVGNLIASVGLLMLGGGTSLASALVLRWVAYLVSVGIIVSSRPRRLAGRPSRRTSSRPAPPGQDDTSLWVRSKR